QDQHVLRAGVARMPQDRDRWVLDDVRGPGPSARAGSVQSRAHLLASPLFEETDRPVVHKTISKGGGARGLVSSAATVEQYPTAQVSIRRGPWECKRPSDKRTALVSHDH